MRFVSCLSIGLGVAMGCGSGGESPGAAAGASSGAATSSSSSGSSGGGGAASSSGSTGGGAAQGGGGTGGAAQGGGGGGQGGGGGGDITAELISMDFYVNCQPIVADDPIHGSFIAGYANLSNANSGKATILDAVLTLSNGVQSLAWPITVQPPDSGNLPPGYAGQQAHVKQDGSSGESSPCNFCQGTWKLDVTWDVGAAQTVKDSLDGGQVSCAF